MARILLIGPSFFGYRDSICEELKRRGHIVSSVNDRPSESVAFKSIARLGYSLLDGSISSYAKDLAKQIHSGDYEHIIYLGGMTFCFSRQQVLRLRAATSASFSAYLWDSVANCPRLSQSIDLFDRVLSFDPTDCEQHGFELRPLFFSNEYRNIPPEPKDGFRWDACFIGSVHQPSKFETISAICDSLNDCGVRVYTHYYMPSYSSVLLRKAFHSAYRGQSFKHEALSRVQIADCYAHSIAIVDSPQHQQHGLTMRTIEAVGSRRKILTTNSEVVKYDFASKDMVLIWDGSPETAIEFINRPFNFLSQEVYEQYTISAFVNTLIGEGTHFSGYQHEGKAGL